MAITYNKQFVTKDRRVSTRGPRDRQLAQERAKLQQSAAGSVDTGLVDELRNQITELKNQLAAKPASSDDMFTAEQVNEEILKAIEAETVQVKSAAKLEVASLQGTLDKVQAEIKSEREYHKKELAALKEVIKNKDEMIEQLKAAPAPAANTADQQKMMALLEEATRKMEDMARASTGLSEVETDPDRPQMDVQFVDPIEKETNVEAHIETVTDVGIDKKEQMNDKVNKLKSLMGKLPSKKG